MTRNKVLLTGAAGKIAGQLLPALRERYDMVLLDIREHDANGAKIDGIHKIDLFNTDRDSYREMFRGCDAVIHSGFIGNSDPKVVPSLDQRFADEMANIQMVYNIYQTALEEKVRRVVVASSNHAADFYEPLLLDGALDVVDPDDRALSDNYYGWAKEAYEHLGFVFATGRQSGTGSTAGQPAGSQLENIHLRIGGPRETDIDDCSPGDLRSVRRALAAYLSERDMQQLVIKSIETRDINDAHGIPFQIFYGISGNSHAFWSIANARKIIDYQPQDNSETRFIEKLTKHIAASKGYS